jgi:hypothetical protein
MKRDLENVNRELAALHDPSSAASRHLLPASGEKEYAIKRFMIHSL